ncbi:MAG: L,D-transpeptidase family protein [Deltaproteobacteria bacterium]|nr:L,D-transpeptidase family protein [Deltaproteobacteria bacterium]
MRVLLWALVVAGAACVDAASPSVSGSPGPAAPSTSPAGGVAMAASSVPAPSVPSALAAPTTSAGPATDVPRLTSVGTKTWIRPTPAVQQRFLGYLRIGQSVLLRSPEIIRGQGCPKGFYAIEPRGYVCHDRTVTLERSTPFLRVNAHTLPAAGPFPYHYALSNGAPMYARVPTAREQKRSEWRYGRAGTFLPMPMFQKGHEHLATTEPIVAADPMPSFLADGGGARGRPLGLLKRTIPHGSMLAYTRAFDAGGRTFLLSADLTVVPADRVRRFRRSTFRGVVLGAAQQLPLAWFVGKPGTQYQLNGTELVATQARWAVRSTVSLAPGERQQAGRRFHPTVPRAGHPQRFVDAAEARLVRRRAKRPFGVRPGDKWVIVSITRGTLVAYDDLTPVFATLVSPGQGGLPRPGGDAIKDSTTPTGTYRITFKDRAATMSPEFGANRSFWIADVPHTQYFNPPFALHGTYWHERFGEPMSAGCVNLSPVDAKWLFDWTDPAVPAGWQGATGAGAKANGPASWVVITR